MGDSCTVAEFYSHKSVFITGATGFMGKILVEKLLRSCPDIKAIYILVRSKKEKSMKERMDAFFKCPIFENVKHLLDRVVPLEGEMEKTDLGLSLEDRRVLTREVAVVFHCAATVKFTESLSTIIRINVLGTKMLLEMSKSFQKLEAWIYVSTAFSNGERFDVEEKVYSPPIHHSKLLQLYNILPPEMLEKLKEILISGHPNTYTLSKQFAENLLVEESDNLPVTIVRPSIVTSVWKEPIPGFVDNAMGFNGLIVGASCGIFNCIQGNYTANAETIPVDVSINHIIVAAWYTALHRSPQDGVMVVHSVDEPSHRVTWCNIVSFLDGEFERYPHRRVIRPLKGQIYVTPLGFRTASFMFDYCFLVVATFFCLLAGRKARLLDYYYKFRKLNHVLIFFMVNNWTFKMDNIQLLQDRLTPQDQEKFYLTTKGLEWREYWRSCVLSNRLYIFKEDFSTLQSSRKAYWLKYLLASFLKVAFFFFLAFIVTYVWRHVPSSG